MIEFPFKNLNRGHYIRVLTGFRQKRRRFLRSIQNCPDSLHVNATGAGPENDVAFLVDCDPLDTVDHTVLFERADRNYRVKRRNGMRQCLFEIFLGADIHCNILLT